jgi:hypothetical protein
MYLLQSCHCNTVFLRQNLYPRSCHIGANCKICQGSGYLPAAKSTSDGSCYNLLQNLPWHVAIYTCCKIYLGICYIPASKISYSSVCKYAEKAALTAADYICMYLAAKSTVASATYLSQKLPWSLLSTCCKSCPGSCYVPIFLEFIKGRQGKAGSSPHNQQRGLHLGLLIDHRVTVFRFRNITFCGDGHLHIGLTC